MEKISSFIDQWWKLIMVLSAIVGLIYEISVLHLTIQENEAKIELLEQYIHDEFELRDQRSDKRYNRAMEMGFELKEDVEEIEDELEQHIFDFSEERGKNEMYRKLHKE